MTMLRPSSPRSRFRNLALAALLTMAVPLAFPPSVLADSPPVADVRASSDHEDPTPVLGPAGKTLVSNYASKAVGPGMTLTTFDRFDARGWVSGYVLRVDLSTPAVSADLLYPGVVTAAEPLSRTAGRAGAVAGVNSDFFDINSTKAPLGAMVQNGDLIKGGVPGYSKVVGVGADGLARMADLLLEGTVTLPAGSLPLAGLNQTFIPAGGVGLYTPVWGAGLRDAVTAGAAAREVVVADGLVVSNTTGISTTAIPENGFILIGREAGAQALAALQPGDAVTVRYAQKTSAAAPFTFAAGGNQVLMQNGKIMTTDDRDTHPRTAAGITADSKEMILAAVDGRQAHSRGMTLLELAQLMESLGAHDALNLDGGGSTTFLTRLPGDEAVTVVNSPSDGYERSVPNGVGIFTVPGSGELDGLRVEPASTAAYADRVFPGLTRRFTAKGYDETYGPAVAGSVDWQALPGDVGNLDENGVFTARKPGSAVVQAKAEPVKGTTPIRVIGELGRLETAPARLGLAAGATGSFTVVGYDANGYAAPIEPDDVTLSYDASLVSITPNEQGGFTVVPSGEGAVLVTVSAGGKESFLPVTIGLATVPVDNFDTKGPWGFAKFPAQVGASLAWVPGRSGQGAELSYDFSTSTATRAAYLQAIPDVPLPGEPQRIGLWVKGDGKGAWLRMVIKDNGNTSYTLTLADRVDWTGWRYVETAVPAGVQYPLRLYRIYPVETNKARQYTGALVFDDLSVKVAASLDVPAKPLTADPLVVQGELDSQRWRFALLSDLHVTAAAPDSKDVRNARAALQQALATGVDFIVIGGDFVDTAYPDDFALAKRILAEEVGNKVPVYYVPGNHEIMGPGNLNNYLAAGNQNRYSFDHKGTRFVLLDSSTGSFRTADFDQLVELQASLEHAARSPKIKNVVVFGHHPTRDPMPTKASQLADEREARLVEQWLTEFRENSSGKGAMYIAGHAHMVNLQRVEGVPYMVLGSVGKTPYGPADNGGFYAWTLFGVDPTAVPDRAAGPEHAAEGSRVSAAEWIRAEVRPLVESITLDAPASLKAGETAAITAVGNQAAGRTFPLRYPATVVWSGSENLLVGEGHTDKFVAQFDPATGELTAFAAGEVTLRVEAGGATTEITIAIEP
jgi:predicted phosphodiesterase